MAEDFDWTQQPTDYAAESIEYAASTQDTSFDYDSAFNRSYEFQREQPEYIYEDSPRYYEPALAAPDQTRYGLSDYLAEFAPEPVQRDPSLGLQYALGTSPRVYEWPQVQGFYREPMVYGYGTGPSLSDLLGTDPQYVNVLQDIGFRASTGLSDTLRDRYVTEGEGPGRVLPNSEVTSRVFGLNEISRVIGSNEVSPLAEYFGKPMAEVDKSSAVEQSAQDLKNTDLRSRVDKLLGQQPDEAVKTWSAFDPASKQAAIDLMYSQVKKFADDSSYQQSDAASRNNQIREQNPGIPTSVLDKVSLLADKRVGEEQSKTVLESLGLRVTSNNTIDPTGLKGWSADKLNSTIARLQFAVGDSSNKDYQSALRRAASAIETAKALPLETSDIDRIRITALEGAKVGLDKKTLEWLNDPKNKDDVDTQLNDLKSQIESAGTLTKANEDSIRTMAQQGAARIMANAATSANKVYHDFFRDRDWKGDTVSYNVENILMLLSAGLGAYGALIAQPQAAKENYKFQEKMAKRAEKYNIEMFERQASFARSGGGGGGSGRGTPSKVAPVRLGV